MTRTLRRQHYQFTGRRTFSTGGRIRVCVIRPLPQVVPVDVLISKVQYQIPTEPLSQISSIKIQKVQKWVGKKKTYL